MLHLTTKVTLPTYTLYCELIMCCRLTSCLAYLRMNIYRSYDDDVPNVTLYVSAIVTLQVLLLFCCKAKEIWQRVRLRFALYNICICCTKALITFQKL